MTDLRKLLYSQVDENIFLRFLLKLYCFSFYHKTLIHLQVVFVYGMS